MATLVTRLPAFTHAFQPVVDISAREIISYELLLRGPENQSPIWVFNQVDSAQLMELDQASRRQGIALAARLGLDCNLNLNFTPGSVLYENGNYVLETIIEAKRHGIDARRLVLEITEDEVIHNIEAFAKTLNKLRRTGITIAIDDFGSGFAGLKFLLDVHPDKVKLDMSLVRDVHSHGGRQAIVRAICGICLDMGIDIIAEGVECGEEVDFLQGNEIEFYQGYYFSKPGFECLPGVSLFEISV